MKQFGSGLRALGNVLLIDPDSVRRRAEALARRGQNRSAADLLAALAEETSTVEDWLAAAGAWLRHGTLDRAALALDRATELAPVGDPRVRFQFAKLFAMRRDWPRAIVALRATLEGDPRNVEAWSSLFLAIRWWDGGERQAIERIEALAATPRFELFAAPMIALCNMYSDPQSGNRPSVIAPTDEIASATAMAFAFRALAREPSSEAVMAAVSCLRRARRNDEADDSLARHAAVSHGSHGSMRASSSSRKAAPESVDYPQG